MHVTIGTKGPLPFLRFLQPLYNHSHVYCWLCYMLFLLENMELIKLIKRKSINSFSKPNLNLQKYRWLEKPLVKKTLVSSTFAGCFVMGIIHFIEDDITQQRPRQEVDL